MRIFLTEASTVQLQAMLKEMRKYKGVSLSPSDLASWVLEFFSKTQFEKTRPEIAKSFTNFKKLIRDNLKNASSQEELIRSLKDSLAVSQFNKKDTKNTLSTSEIKANKDEMKDK